MIDKVKAHCVILQVLPQNIVLPKMIEFIPELARVQGPGVRASSLQQVRKEDSVL